MVSVTAAIMGSVQQLMALVNVKMGTLVNDVRKELALKTCMAPLAQMSVPVLQKIHCLVILSMVNAIVNQAGVVTRVPVRVPFTPMAISAKGCASVRMGCTVTL